MGLKKYEIITVGGNKRVRALRSWRVQDRYVNIGDVGGIVYDEKTLSQDGACWLFRGNFNFPGARIGGDSIVDVGEATPGVTGSANLDILGSSVVVGAPVRFASNQTSADAVTLTASNFEQGMFANYVVGQIPGTSNSANFIRTKSPIFMGGVAATLKLDVPGYRVLALVLDRDGFVISGTSETASGVGVTMTVPAGQYFILRVTKDPMAAIVPDDATAAQIKFTGTHETKLVMVDSRLELNPTTATAAVALFPGGQNSIASGIKYPDSIIQGSKVVINGTPTVPRAVRLMSEFISVNATIDATTADAQAVGIYHGVNNLVFSGSHSGIVFNTQAPSLIQATNCDNFVVSPTIFPGLAAAQTANMPFIFQGCNVPNGLFYHHAQINNIYTDVDFSATVDSLGKGLGPTTQVVLVSSEQTGMYRVYCMDTKQWGALVESLDSVSALRFAADSPESSYNTTIYKDAYFNGWFDIAGTNVFGNKACSHPLAQVLNVQPRVVQGNFSATSVGATIGAVVTTPLFVSTPVPFRVNGAKGLTVNNLPAGYVALLFLVDLNNVITRFGSGAEALSAAALTDMKAFIRFSKSDNSPITPADLAGVTVTVYNGCKIVNTGATAVDMKGNIRVEDNATLLNSSITGTGYFGGNTVASGLILEGCAFMDGNATLVKTSEGGTMRQLYMRDNSRAVISAVTIFGRLDLRDNAVFSPASYGVSEANIIMRDNATITSELYANGVLKMEGNATVSNGSVTTVGDITLCGSYNQTVNKTWVGKRVIDSIDAPEYDKNVKTQYDF